KVSNGLYAIFFNNQRAKELFAKYRANGCEDLVWDPNLPDSEAPWKKGGLAKGFNPDPETPPFLGVSGVTELGVPGLDDKFRLGEKIGLFPVFRVKVTEAHCFAEWLGGRLPTKKQWLRAAGAGEDKRPGPFSEDEKDLGVGE